jgi:hypothetical protein
MIWVTQQSRMKRETYQILVTAIGFVLPRVAAPGSVLPRATAVVESRAAATRSHSGAGGSRAGRRCWAVASRAEQSKGG